MMRGLELEQLFLTSRREGKVELIFFLNAGDPTLEITFALLRELAQYGVATVELCVPFPNSITDGVLIRESHTRALANDINLLQVLELVRRVRNELGLAIVLLADYAHTVEPIGLKNFLSSCSMAGIHATLIHCLPFSCRQIYVEQSKELGIGRIMSFFVNSETSVRQMAYRESEGFIYLVSRFGRTGQNVSFDAARLDALASIRAETDKPLAVGFGVKTADDIAALKTTGIDAVIIGSAVASVVSKSLHEPNRITSEFSNLVSDLALYSGLIPYTTKCPLPTERTYLGS
jgi:tryptophan synthase alpha chain